MAHLTQHLVVKTQFAVCARADAEIIAELPVIEVMARPFFRLRECRSLVMLVAVCGQHLLDALLHIAARIVVRQRAAAGAQTACSVPASGGNRTDVAACIAVRSAHPVAPRPASVRQRIHQVEIDIVEMLLRNLDRAFGFIGRMDAPQRLQVRVVETLDAERQPVHARPP